METLILLAKSASILGLFYVVYLAVLYKNTLFTAKRHYFIAGIIAAITLPFIEFRREIEVIIPSQPLVMPALDISPVNTAPIAVASQPVEQAINWWQVLVLIYIIGICIMLCRLCAQYISLRQLIASGSRSTKGHYTFVAVTRAISPFSFFSKIVYNPELHTPEELEMIIAHEKVHAQQRHSLDMLLSQITLVIQWCNPFAWMYKNSLEQNLEYLADHQAIQEIKNPKQYQRTLVQVSSPSFAPALTNQFYQSFIKKRIVMLNTPPSRKVSFLKIGLIIPVLALFMYSFNVKEVVQYVEEDASAFAKANTSPNNSNEQKIFKVTPQSTSEDLNRIEREIADMYPKSLVRFSNRRIAKEGIIKRFSFQTKFEGEQKFFTRFDRTINITSSWEGYTIMITNDEEIIVEEQGDQGVSFKIDVDKLVFLDGAGTVFDRALVPSNQTYKPAKKGSYKKSPSSSQLILKDSSALMNTISINNPSYIDSITPSSSLRVSKTTIQDTYSFTITKDTEPEELDKLQKDLKEKHGATLTVSDVNYNDKGEITSIRLDFQDSAGNNKNYTVQSASPIATIYIYRNADGSTGMGNALANSNMEIEQELNTLREQMIQRRKEIMSQRDSMKTDMYAEKEARRKLMEARREQMLAKMEEKRSLGGKAQVDSMRTLMSQRRDSMREQMMQRRDALKSAYKKAKKQNKAVKSGYVKTEDETFYYTQDKKGEIKYYDKWGMQVDKNDSRYAKINNTNFENIKRLALNDTSTNGSIDPIYYVDGKRVTKKKMENLNPDTIDNVSLIKGKSALKLYGNDAVNGVIVIETKE